MLLPNVSLSTRKNKIEYETGIDCLSNCVNKSHFLNYPHAVEYKYNNRGFRDQDWPCDLPASVDELYSLPDWIQHELTHQHNVFSTLEQMLAEQTKLENYTIVNDIVSVPKFDTARDGHHFDILTSQWVVRQILSKFNLANQ